MVPLGIISHARWQVNMKSDDIWRMPFHCRFGREKSASIGVAHASREVRQIPFVLFNVSRLGGYVDCGT